MEPDSVMGCVEALLNTVECTVWYEYELLAATQLPRVYVDARACQAQCPSGAPAYWAFAM